MAFYYMAEMPDIQKNGKRVLYPKLVRHHQVGLNELADSIVRATSFTRGDVVGVLTALSDAMVAELSKGHSVKLDGLGSFSVGLGFREDVEREEVDGDHQVNARSIEVQKIHYRADRALIVGTARTIQLVRRNIRDRRCPESTWEERLQALLRYLEEHKEIRVREYRDLMGLKQSSASRELRSFAKMGYILSCGRASHSFYVLNQSEG